MNLTKPYVPQEISDALRAFPASVSHLMPAWEDIPEEFQDRHNEWVEFQGTWFAAGLTEHFSYVPAIDPTGDGEDRLDGELILRHLSAIQGSFEPKHEHKEAAVAYLASLWMDAVLYGPSGAKSKDQLHTIGPVSVDEFLDAKGIVL